MKAETKQIFPGDLGLIKTDKGESIKDISFDQNVLLVFLRHFGCIFCREALLDLANLKNELQSLNTRPVFVHMSDSEIAYAYFRKYDLEGVDSVSDPSCTLYENFGLVKGTSSQLFGLQNMMRGFEATMQGTMIGLKQIGDGFQMPGVFVIKDGNVLTSFIHKNVSDRPDYLEMIKGVLED